MNRSRRAASLVDKVWKAILRERVTAYQKEGSKVPPTPPCHIKTNICHSDFGLLGNAESSSTPSSRDSIWNGKPAPSPVFTQAA